MASLVDFHADPTADTVIRGLDAGMRARKAREQVATDEAIRQGVGEMMDAGGSAGYQAPATAPRGLDYSGAMAPQPATAPRAPAAPAAATPASTSPAPSQAAAGTLSPEDEDRVVRTVYGEAGNQGEVGQRAVAHVIRNRAKQSGLSPSQVVLAPNQFEPWNNARSAHP